MQREKEYEEARRRIYGESSPAAGDALAKGVRDLSLGASPLSGGGAKPRNSTSLSGAGRSHKDRSSGSRGPSNTSLGTTDKGAPADVVRTPRGPGDGRGGFAGESGRGRGDRSVG